MALFTHRLANAGTQTGLGSVWARWHDVHGLVLGLGLAAIAPVLVSAQTPEDMRAGALVVLELYTAQGCASCPPADEMVRELAGRDDVIALALHVDYWDYIGWADTFASPDHGQRQQRYARRHGHSTIYTPQVVINGTDIMEGFRVMQVMETIAAHQRQTPEVTVSLTRLDGGGLEILASTSTDIAPMVAMASRRAAMPNAVVGTLAMGASTSDATSDTAAVDRPDVAEPGSYVLQVVRYRSTAQVEILGGENAGRTADYANIVTSWQSVGTWDMMSPLAMTVPLSGDDAVAVIVQEAGQGEIIAAARLR